MYPGTDEDCFTSEEKVRDVIRKTIQQIIIKQKLYNCSTIGKIKLNIDTPISQILKTKNSYCDLILKMVHCLIKISCLYLSLKDDCSVYRRKLRISRDIPFNR